MPIETSTLERVIHLLLFVAAAGALGVGALGSLEYLVGGPRRTIRLRHLLVPVAAFVMLFSVERAYHAFA